MTYSGVPQLKLKFKVSQITDLDPKASINLILLKLKDKKYRILDVTDNSLAFYDNPWRLRWNFEPYMLDGGEFEIEVSNNRSLITLSYYLDFFPQFLLGSLIIISTIIDRQYDAALFFVCFYFIVSITEIIRAKYEAKAILRKPITDDLID